MTDSKDEANYNSNAGGYWTSSNFSLTTETLDDKEGGFSVLSPFNEDESSRILHDTRAEMEKVPMEERRKWLYDRMGKYYGSVMPPSLIEMTVSHYFDGDSGISIDVKPDWLDIDKFRRGQKLAVDNLLGLFYADLLSLFIVFSFEDALKPLILTDASSTPYTAFKRYLSTSIRVQNWYTSDPWTPGTPAYKDIQTVRQMHAMVRKKIRDMSDDEYEEKTKIKNAWCPALERSRRDFQSTCPAPKPGQCPYATAANFAELKEYRLSQGEMSATQFAFVGLFILNPKFFGLHDASNEDMDAYCHVWRGIGYLLGIEDDFNFCRGTLDDVRTRSRDLLEYWVKPNFRVVKPEWEHMVRCVVESLKFFFQGCTYETCLLDLAEVMNLQTSRTYDSLLYSVWFQHKLIRFYFNFGSKLRGMRVFANRKLRSAVKKASDFDERKQQKLKARSTKIINSYLELAKKDDIIWKKNQKNLFYKWVQLFYMLRIKISHLYLGFCRMLTYRR